ncbi:MAG: hypothetical protein JST00_39405 [Deltaproteobacteria bacterium]|nr:hypothetical protein [Deltaproteobacteria bacterium]
MTFSERRRIGAVCALLIATALPGVAHAQKSAADIESARQLYNQGLELRDKGDAKGALEKFKAAHALGGTPITGIELCKAHAALKQPVEAREVCLGVARIPPLAGETQRSADARAEAARVAEEVKPRIAQVRIKLTGVPPGREPTVTVDGTAVPAAALGEPRAVNPGQHQITAKIGNGPVASSGIDLREGETKEIVLPVQAPPEEPVRPHFGGGRDDDYERGRRERGGGLNAAVYTGFTIAGIGVVMGTIGGVVALNGKAELKDTCTDSICGREQHDDLDAAKRAGVVSTTGFVIGGVGVIIGVIGLATSGSSRSGGLSAPKPKTATVTPDIGPGGVGVHGVF